jgi:hypothetical protein
MRATIENDSFSYLIIYGIVGFTKFSLFPWILKYLHTRTGFSSWSQVVLGYGLLITVLALGEFCGKYIVSKYCSKLSNAVYTCFFVILTGSYIAIAFVSRFFLLVWLFFLVGLTGSVLSGFSLNVDKRFPFAQFQKRKDDFDQNRFVERAAVCFTFSTLLTAFLYDNRPHVEFPCYYLSLLLSSSFLLMLLYYLILQRTIGKRSNRSANSMDFVSSASISGNINDSSGKDNSNLIHSNSVYDQPPNYALLEEEKNYNGPVPVNFLQCCSGDIKQARVMYGKMLAWRRYYHVDQIFDIPQRGFHEIVKYYPHAIHGYSRDGCGVVYEILGKGKVAELQATGLTLDHLVWHFNLRNEVVFRHVLSPERLQEAARKAPAGAIQVVPFPSKYANDPNVLKEKPVYRMMTIVDLKGISFSSFSSEVIGFLVKSSAAIDNYYPQQVARIVICNVPYWFSTIWSLVKGALPQSAIDKVDFDYDFSTLDKYIHSSQRPKEYGGTDSVPLGEWEGNQFFLELAEKWEKEEQEHHRLHSGVPQSTKPTKTETAKNSFTSSAGHSHSGNSNSNSMNEKKRGRFADWLANSFKKEPPPTKAHLGGENAYHFNNLTGKWELDVEKEELLLTKEATENQTENEEDDEEEEEETENDSDDDQQHKGRRSKRLISSSKKTKIEDGKTLKRSDSLELAFLSSSSGHHHHSGGGGGGKKKKGGPPKMNKEQIEDLGIILAIHAAHTHSSYARMSSDTAESGGLSMSSNQILSRGDNGQITANLATNTAELGIGRSEPLIANDHDLSSGQQQETTGGGSSISSSTSGVARPGDGVIFVYCLTIFFVVQGIHSLIWTLLPVWLSAPLRSGGLGFSVRDLGLMFSTTGLFVLHFHLFYREKLDMMLKASPVRSLRIGVGLLLVASFGLQSYLRWLSHPIEESLHHSHFHHNSILPVGGVGGMPSSLPLGGLSVSEHVSGVGVDHDHDHHSAALGPPQQLSMGERETAIDWEAVLIGQLFTIIPSLSFSSLLIPAFLIALLISAVHVLRRSSAILFQLAVSSSFKNFTFIRFSLTTAMEVSGPFLAALVYSLVYSMRLKHPLDSSFFLSFSNCLVLVAYLLSLQLLVQFRGDYGVMADDQGENNSSSGVRRGSGTGPGGGGLISSWFLSTGNTNKGASLTSASGERDRSRSFSSYKKDPESLVRDRKGGGGKGGGGDYLSHPSSSSSSHPHARVRTPSELENHPLAVPLGDLNLLFSSIGNSYGSKLYNLKDDFKDV